MSDRKIFEEYEPEDRVLKLIKKSKESPFVPIGFAGFIGAVGLGAYNYKNRGKMSTSMYLMQLRVIAQGTVVGALCLGMMYSIGNRLLAMNKKDDKPASVAHH